MKGICTDNHGIENLITKGLVYVDKTDVLLALIADPAASQYFLSRPRRFGKSLMIATLREIFKGRRELFKDTFIGKSDYDWPVYPVIHLDLSKVVASTPEVLETRLEDLVSNLAKQFGVPFDRTIPSGDNFENLINYAAASSGQKQVVVLIDEYDAPVNGFVDDPDRLTAFRDVMHQFFLVLKANVEHIRFLMATGVTRFTKISLFSCLNNPTDLSMDRRAARLCGYTPEEIEQNFHEHIQAFADEKGVTYEAMFKDLLAWYDSYRFSPESEIRVCNPVSLGKALVNHLLTNYWESTGLASSAVMRVKANREIISDWNGKKIDRTKLDSAGEPRVPLATLLYQTGYLTIGGVSESGKIILRVPNREVLDSVNIGTISNWLGDASDDAIADMDDAREVLCAKGMDFVLEKSLIACFARIPHEWKLDSEAEAKRFFLLYCHFLGAKVKGEQETSLGRADAVLELPNGVYLFEFKYAKSSAEALAQIKERGYADAYRDDSRPVWLIGCNYNPETRNLDRPEMERMV